jgi:hypothetical protein
MGKRTRKRLRVGSKNWQADLLLYWLEQYWKRLEETEFYAFIPKYAKYKIVDNKLQVWFPEVIPIADLPLDFMGVRYEKVEGGNIFLPEGSDKLFVRDYRASDGIYNVDGTQYLLYFVSTPLESDEEYKNLPFEKLDRVELDFSSLFAQIINDFDVPVKVTLV